MLTTPYITDRPLRDRDLFFGRTASLDLLSDHLHRGERILLLFGKRHIGKTSLLNQLPTYLGERYIVRRIDWPALERDVVGTPMSHLLVGICRALGHTAVTDDHIMHSDADAAVAYVRALYSGAQDTTDLLCFDGIPADVLTDRSGWQEALGILCEAMPPSLVLLLAIEGYGGNDHAWLQGYAQIALGSLNEASAEDLLTTPVRSRIAFDYESIRRIHRLAGGEPLLLQRFGGVLFEERIAAGWVGLPEVESVVPRVLEQSVPEFRAQWQGLDIAAQITLFAFAEMLGSHGVGSAQDVSRHLARLRVDMPMSDVEAALDAMVQLRLLDRLGGGTYRFSVELFRLWVRSTQNIDVLVRSTKRYRRRAPRPPRPMGPRRIDWASLLLWLVAAALTLLVILVWRTRDTRTIWTVEPTRSIEASVVLPTVELPTPEMGIVPGRIIYVGKARTEDPWDIYAMRGDGSDPVRITENDADDTSPVLSPDGRKIAFVSTRDGNREVYVMSNDGAAPLNVTLNAAEDWTPTWSPDGQRIAFASFRDGNWEIYAMKADGTELKRLTQHTAADYSPAWSPDGQQIAFVSNRSGNLDIWLMAADGGNVRPFTDDPATDQAPTWSPDSQEIAWESYREGNMEIYAATLDGAKMRSVSRDAYADDHGATWSPWGTHIAFFSNRDGGWDIYTVNLETGQRTNVTQSPLLEQYPAWGR